MVVAMINQLPAAGSNPVPDTNKWQKWGVFSRKHPRRVGVVAWVGQAVDSTQMALRLVGRAAALAVAVTRSR